jgi:hypothetical protein
MPVNPNTKFANIENIMTAREAQAVLEVQSTTMMIPKDDDLPCHCTQRCRAKIQPVALESKELRIEADSAASPHYAIVHLGFCRSIRNVAGEGCARFRKWSHVWLGNDVHFVWGYVETGRVYE